LIELDNLSSLNVSIITGKQKYSGETPGFVENEIIKGKVLKVLDSETAILLINGRKYTADTRIPLKAGDLLEMKVKELSPVPVLRPMGIRHAGPVAANVSVILSALKENLWKSVFEKINAGGGSITGKALWDQIIKDLPGKLLSDGRPESLCKMIENSGIFWEAKLKNVTGQKSIDSDQIRQLIDSDLKGLLSRLISETNGEEPDSLQLLAAMKNMQILDRLGSEQDRKIFLPLPVILPDGHFVIIQLLFQFPPKDKDVHENSAGDKHPLNISVLLELSKLGPIRADFTIKGKRVEGVFKIAVRETLKLVETGIPAFVKTLEDKGLKIHHIGCILKKPEIVAQPLLLEIIQTADNNINLVA
jgi:hypothetical protein